MTCQRFLGPGYLDNALRTAVTEVCRGYPEIISGLLNPSYITAGLFGSLRVPLRAYLNLKYGLQGHLLPQNEDNHNLYLLDRHYC